ncbi:hypothetical protein EDD16DRAFT_1524278 [Pisolithus croceorrhizus]|nr:hypothetical protein EDD16DRAFT_1524278 [Pisolithus croceorrhizus]
MYRQRPSPLPYNSSLRLGNSALRDKFHAAQSCLRVTRYPRYTMAFFKSFFRNSADMQDKSFALESLEGSSPTTDSARGGATGGGESTMVIYKRSSVAENSSAVLPPSKVHLREVDHSSTLHTQVYGLKKSLYHKNADFNNLEAQIRGKDAVIAEQAQLLSQLSQGLKEVKQQTAAQSSGISPGWIEGCQSLCSNQTALQRLQRDLDEVQNHAVVEAKAGNPTATDSSFMSPFVGHLSVAQEEEDQERSEMPAPEPPAPALNLSDDVPHETDAAPPQTHSWMPSRRGRGKKVQKEPKTHEQQLQNLAYVRDLFKAAFTVTQDEKFLQCGGVSDQVAKAFAEGTGPGPDPSHLQWDFKHPASSP